MPALLKIRSHSFAPGESGSLTVNLATLASRTPIDIPLHVFRAAAEGPVLLLMAGMHGDEVNGTEIIRRMISRGLLRPQSGSVIALPLLNIYGFINFARYVPDGKDVNRSFPGSETGSLASRMAHFVTNEILPLMIDYGVDFHTGGGMIFNYPQVRCVFDREQNLAMGKAFAPPLLINAPLRDKSLRQQAEKTGKTILVYEAGESMRFDEHAIQEGLGGTLRLMNHLGMAGESPPTTEPTRLIVSDTWVRALHAGFFHPTVAPGDTVVQGQLLGYLTGPDGTDLDPVNSLHPSIIISVNNMPVVNVGDALLHLSKT